MDIVSQTILLGILSLVTDIVGWGIAGYVILRIIGFPDKGWYWSWIIIFMLYSVYEIWTDNYLLELGITIANTRILKYLDNDINSLLRNDSLDHLLNALFIFIGFSIGRYLEVFPTLNIER